MATKKTETNTEAVVEATPKKTEYVSYYCPVDMVNHTDSRTVGINGIEYRIKRGETVSLPKNIVDFMNNQDAEDLRIFNSHLAKQVKD